MSFHEKLNDFIDNFNYTNGINKEKNCSCLDCVSMKKLHGNGYITGSACKKPLNTCNNCICESTEQYKSRMKRGYTPCPFGYAEQGHYNFYRGDIFDDQMYLNKNKETRSNGTPQLNPRPMTRVGLTWRN